MRNVTAITWGATALIAASAGLACGWFLSRLAYRRRLRALQENLEAVPDLDPDSLSRVPSELRPLALAIRAGRERHYARQRNLDEAATAGRLQAAAARLAHDIRSPVAALEVFLTTGVLSPETHTQVLRPALSRLRTIAGLLTGERLAQEILSAPRSSSQPVPGTADAEPQPALVSAIIEAVVSSLRVNARVGRDRIEIAEDSLPYSLFLHVSLRSFRLALEDLAACMLEEGGGVAGRVLRFSARPEGDLVRCSVEILDHASRRVVRGRTGAPGESRFGGLLSRVQGLLLSGGGSAARRDGEMAVDITAPAASPPPWFLPELLLPQDRPLLIADDDLWVHHMWDKVLGESPGGPPSEVIHFLSLEQLEAWLSDGAHSASLGLLLIDDGYLGCEQSGLDLLERFRDVMPRAVLVTGRWEDPHVRSRSLGMGLRLLPKNLVTRVPIVTGTERRRARLAEPPDAVLVDDHLWIRKGWELSARQAGRRLSTFGSIQEFLEIERDLDRSTILFIDSDLRDEMPGEQFAWRLFDAGFTDIYLATGFDADQFPPMPWLSGIIGKEPPDWAGLERRDDDPLARLVSGGAKETEE